MLSQQRAHDPIDLDRAYKPRTNASARRTISIFSRRGVDSIDLADPTMMRGFPPPIRAIDGNGKQRPAPAPRKPSLKPKKTSGKGTILNAVPKTGIIPLKTPLSARSPAPFAKSAKESSPLEFACATAVRQASTLRETQAHIIAEQRSPNRTHTKAKSSIDRIGVWVDGIIHWEGGSRPTRHSEEYFDSRSMVTPGHSRAQSDESAYRSRTKPNLTVVIPPGKLLTREQSIAALRRPATSSGPSRRTSDTVRGSFPVREVSPLTDCGPDGRKRSLSRATTVFSPVEQSRANSSASQREEPSRASSTPSSANKDESDYSNRSSSTSVEAPPTQITKRLRSTRSNKSASAVFSIINPTVAAALDDYTPITKSYMDKPLPPTPTLSEFSHSFPMPPNLKPISPTAPKRPQTARPGNGPRPLLKKAYSFQDQSLRSTRSMTQLDVFDQEFMRTSPYIPGEEEEDDDEDDVESESESEVESTTLSQAEIDLHEHLGRMSEHIPTIAGLSLRSKELQDTGLLITNVTLPTPSDVQPKEPSAAIVLQPPTLARRNSYSPASSPAASNVDNDKLQIRRLSDPCSQPTDTHDAPPADWWVKHRLSRSVTSADLPRTRGFADFIDRDDKLIEQAVIDDGLIVVSGPEVMRPKLRRTASQAASQEAAEGVLVKILASLTSIEDLMNAILINRGMHRVYRENERRLVRRVARNESAPGYELRQWLKPTRKSQLLDTEEVDDDEITIVEQSPASYVQAWRRDTNTINSLKTIIVAGCQTYLRKETVAAMSDKAHPRAQQVTDAFWRIWTFCAIFGNQKGRDEDLIGQLDWLKGGRLANNLDCAATVSMNVEFDVGSILLNAPEYFGSGNGEGLTADQLYDITEIWTCMASLLQGYLGRVDQAKEYGIYDNCSIEKGDAEKEIEKQEYMLEEWIAWVVTLGPTVVLELAEYASDTSSAGFALAKQNGWTEWSPPTQTTSRCTFLKEPVARLYEERVIAANVKAQTALEQEEKEKSRRRIQGHAEEIRARRQNSAFKRVPLVDMSMERPMSIMSTLSGGVNLTPRFPPKNMTLPPVPSLAAIHPALRSAPAISPSSAATLQQTITSPAMTQHQAAQPARQALRAFNGVGVGTVELAVQRIMSMGFTAAEATLALKTTDTGDGLRVDRAVDWLLRTRAADDNVKWTGSV
ncbi:hypothetical protein AMS68_006603 [Peltaster fructicola]|uniref:UBA domain-containing protein n=1 Tax=Peltaster fructicola TaxID=286661 RepID=A0A6H0Y2B7_9PEZI|nr:hypothetical protein AMS68_006603 [Peltaster fructicola]